MTHTVAFLWFLVWPIFLIVAYQAVKFFAKKTKHI